jgi:ZIP family zinc transporter
LTSALTASLAAFGVTLLSGLGALYLREHKSMIYASCAGALAGGAALFLLPDSFRLFRDATTELPLQLVWVSAIVGFTFFHALERGHPSRGSTRLAGLGGAFGLSVHSFLDGVVIGQGFRAGGETGAVLALAVMLHRLADGASAVGVMLGTEHSLRQTVWMLLLTSAAPILGAASQSFFYLPTAFFALLLSFFAGMLLFLAASRLVPEARRASASGLHVALFFVAGFVIVYAAYFLAGH